MHRSPISSHRKIPISKYGVIWISQNSLSRANLPTTFHLGTIRYIVYGNQILEDMPQRWADELLEIAHSAIQWVQQSTINPMLNQEIRKMVLSIFLQKRKSFEHERELRAMAFLTDRIPDLSLGIDSPDSIPHPTEHGAWQPLELSKLIEHIRIAPNAQGWFQDLVQRVAAHYGLNVPVDRTSV